MNFKELWKQLVYDSSSSRLPADYQEVKYLTGTGTQYIDVGYAKPNIITELKYKLAYNSAALNNSRLVIGPLATSPNFFGKFTSNKFELDGTYTTMTAETGKVYEFDYKATTTNTTLKVTCDGTSETLTSSKVSGTTTAYNWLYGALNQSGTASFIHKGDYYELELYDNGTLVRHLVPCYRKSDNVAGMYDINNSGINLFDKNNYYYNQYMTSSGTRTTSVAGLSSSDYIPFNAGDSITIKGTPAYPSAQSNTLAINWFDSNKNILSTRPTKNITGTSEIIWTETAPANAAYVVVNIQTNTVQNGDTWMIVEGSTAPTEYEPYPFYTNAGTGTFTVGPDVN